MKKDELDTCAVNTWCPGCGNFAILNSIKAVLSSLRDDGFPLQKVVIASGIGCHAKIVDYINVNSFYSLHGRVPPPVEGIKLANSELKVIGFSGDGDGYGEGLAHLLFAAKRNVDVTMIIHDNRVYGLTTGQFTPTSPFGFKGRSTPMGSREYPFNPLELILSSGATFIARGYSNRMDLLKKIFKEAILHKGFSIVDVLQVCVTWFNLYSDYNERVYELKDHDSSSYEAALGKIREWDYNSNEAPIALGILYNQEKSVFEPAPLDYKVSIADRERRIEKLLRERG